MGATLDCRLAANSPISTTEVETTWRFLHRDVAAPWPHTAIVAALECSGHAQTFHAVFSVNQIPLTSELGISLWSEDGRCVERALLGGYFAEGHFEDLHVSAAGAEFRFFGATPKDGTPDRWRVEFLAKARVTIPFLPEAIGVIRDGGFLRRMRITRIRAPK